jgi:16S rRNA (cytidine1402-2'-O)-methyltransferase
MTSSLYIIATPIGNLSDITLRAIETLKLIDILFCEDTRRSENLMRHLGFKKRMFRYDEHTHQRASHQVIEFLKQGISVALLTDAGTPGIADPGARLVSEVVKAGFSVIPIPGPSSVAAALSASGLPGDGFIFLGFLSRKPSKAKRALQEAIGLGKTVVLFESPFRVAATMDLIAAMIPQAFVVVAKELTKIHEEFIRGEVEFVRQELKKRPEKGEFVIMIGPEAHLAKEPLNA